MAKKNENDLGGGTSQPGPTGGSIATKEENASLEHTQGGVTTRDDGLDAGVPMLPGSPDEPVGPEDALGPGPKRGDYSTRVGPGEYQPHQAVKQPDGTVRLEPQRPRVENIGDESGAKGGVDTEEATKRTVRPAPGTSKSE